MINESNAGAIAKYALTFITALLVSAVGGTLYTWRDASINAAAISRLESATALSIARIESDVKFIDTTLADIAARAHENSILSRQREKEADQCAARVGQLERDVASIRPRTEKAAAGTEAERSEIRDRLERLEQGHKGSKP